MRELHHFVNGQSVSGTSERFADVYDPNTGEVQARVSLATPSELDSAVQAAVNAQPAWAATNAQRQASTL